MSTPVIAVRESTPIEDYTRIMEDNQIRRVPVINGGGMCCGIVSQADIAEERVATTHSRSREGRVATGSRLGANHWRFTRMRGDLAGCYLVLCRPARPLSAGVEVRVDRTAVQLEIRNVRLHIDDGIALAGYSKNTPAKGLKTYMPDFDDLR